ncbi:MAG: site-specific DNA-methyltransferase [Dehalobacter sp. 4CP]|nr:site-specific DNA-methyltransferase [Dehalobacter sp. 4CP]
MDDYPEEGRSDPLESIEPTEQNNGFALEAPQFRKNSVAQPGRRTSRTAVSRVNKDEARQVLSYRYDDKRKNNPHVGMVTSGNDCAEEKSTWVYDSHIDPTLNFDSSRADIETLIDDALGSGDEGEMRQALEQLKRMQTPYLAWAGKAERTSFEVDSVSLYVHERIDPATILAEVQKRMKAGKGKGSGMVQPDLWSAPFENLPLREAIDYYKHDRDWANRLIAGDSLLVMNSLIQKESMAGKVQMIYIDPPYGIKYGSNFQPFVNKRDVKDRKDEDLTQEPEMIKAFRDTWELGIHSYLTYLRDRLLLAKELLSDTGSIFVQISDENLHHVREIMDEVFGTGNFVSQISYSTTTGTADMLLSNEHDKILWYTKSKEAIKYRQLWLQKGIGDVKSYKYEILDDRVTYRSLSKAAREGNGEGHEWKVAQFSFAVSQDPGHPDERVFRFHGTDYDCGPFRHWKTKNPTGIERLSVSGRVIGLASQLNYIRFLDDYPLSTLTNVWDDTGSAGYSNQDPKRYVVQTDNLVIERCLLMTTDPGDLVLDITCGSGTTAFVAEKWGRRWITCDTSRVAVTLAKQRLMTASYDYYDLKYPNEGLKGGFIYKTVPHVTLKSIANNVEIDEIYAAMHPAIEAVLIDLNQALKGQPIEFRVTEGGRSGEILYFEKGAALLEWEVPFDLPEEWPAEAHAAFAAFHTARQHMQKKMDASIAAHADREILYDQPQVSKTRLRITGPFTVEAVPFPTVLALEEAQQASRADVAVARSGETSRQALWRDELIKTGIRGKGGQKLKLADLEPLPDLRYIHAVGTVAETGERVAVSFGPEHAALEQRQVEIAMRDAEKLFPLPKMIVFCAFTFDPEAAKDIDDLRGITALKVQMNTDLLTEDLKKARANNESFWLMGQPDVEVRKLKDGKYQVEVHGFDYFDTARGELRSGGKSNIAMWSLDTDYDDRSLFPRQVFFPMAGKKDGWYRLKKDIRAELNESLLAQFHGTISLPFEAGENGRVAVKIVDDRGIESLKVMDLN